MSASLTGVVEGYGYGYGYGYEFWPQLQLT
jgi:hypothetical protein